MSETPERIWACMDGPMVGLFVSGGYNAGWPEYVRADLFDAGKTDRISALEARLRAELAEAGESAQSAHAVGFAAGIEAAKSFLLDAREISGDGEEVPPSGGTLLTLIASLPTSIRALTPPDITAAAARVLLAAWPTDTSFDAAFAACATAYHGGDQMQDTMDRTLATVSAALRALAEVKP